VVWLKLPDVPVIVTLPCRWRPVVLAVSVRCCLPVVQPVEAGRDTAGQPEAAGSHFH